MITIYYDAETGEITSWRYGKDLGNSPLALLIDTRPRITVDYEVDVANSRVDLETLQVVPK